MLGECLLFAHCSSFSKCDPVANRVIRCSTMADMFRILEYSLYPLTILSVLHSYVFTTLVQQNPSYSRNYFNSTLSATFNANRRMSSRKHCLYTTKLNHANKELAMLKVLRNSSSSISSLRTHLFLCVVQNNMS